MTKDSTIPPRSMQSDPGPETAPLPTSATESRDKETQEKRLATLIKNRDLMILAQDTILEREDIAQAENNKQSISSNSQEIQTNSSTSSKSIEDQIKDRRGNKPLLETRLFALKKIGIGSGFTREEEQIKKKIIKVKNELKYTPSIVDAAAAVKEDNKGKSYINKMKNALESASSLIGNLSTNFSNKPRNQRHSRDKT